MNTKDLIRRAKGPGKTMQKFAKECGISFPQLYRIARGDIKRLPPDEKLHAIAENSYKKSVSYEDLKSSIESAFYLKAYRDMYTITEKKTKGVVYTKLGECKLLSDKVDAGKFDLALDIKTEGDKEYSGRIVIDSKEVAAASEVYFNDELARFFWAAEHDECIDSSNVWYYLFFWFDPEHCDYIQSLNALSHEHRTTGISVIYINSQDWTVWTQIDCGPEGNRPPLRFDDEE